MDWFEILTGFRETDYYDTRAKLKVEGSRLQSLANGKDYSAPSVFRPEALLREARRQKQLPLTAVPRICVLDPDGDLVRHLKRTGASRRHEGWACYHTELVAFDLDGVGEVGVVGCAVGASFVVLVAEQLFASGCEFLVSITSAGQIADAGLTPYFVLIDRALRDEGTSYHYMPPAACVRPARTAASAARAGGRAHACPPGPTHNSVPG